MVLTFVTNHDKQSSETCIICQKPKCKGIHLYTSFICTDCEKEMLATKTNESKYKYFVKRLRHIRKPQIFS